MELTLAALIASITVFVLAIFLGFELISKVPPTLHTPLMSGANAISGITIVGALILSNAAFNDGRPDTAATLAFLALVMATINCVGGFMVTNRMLEMIAGKRRRKKGGD
jgi:NAD(P) transhydrogenase subunit alpha